MKNKIIGLSCNSLVQTICSSKPLRRRRMLPYAFRCASWFIYSSLFLLFLLSQSNLHADTVQDQYKYIPQEYRDYFYNVLTPAIRERCSVTSTNTPSACGWHDLGDTIVKGGAEGWENEAVLNKGKNKNVYFRDTNGNGSRDSGEYIWKDVNGNQEFDYEVDTVISGSPTSTNTGDWGKKNSLYYYDANNNGNWDDGEALWVDGSTGIISDMNAFHQTVTSLIPQFVNHTDSDGDWTGQTDIPNWNTAPTGTNSILVYLAETRIVPTDINMLSDWYYQQYEILNLLIWVNKTIYPTIFSKKASWFDDFDSWESFRSTFPENNDYTFVPDDQYIYRANIFGRTSVSTSAWFSSFSWLFTFTVLRIKVNNETNFSVSADVYIKPQPLDIQDGYGGYAYVPDNGLYWDILEDYPCPEFGDTLYKKESLFMNANDPFEKYYPSGDYNPHLNPEIDGYKHRQLDFNGVFDVLATQYKIFPILKFDNPNGFHPLTDPSAIENSNIEDTNRDDLVDVGADIDSFGADMGTAVFDTQHPEPQIFIPLAVSQWDQLPVHAYFMQGGYNHTEYIYDYNFWTQANISEDGMFQTYSLNSRAGVNTLIVKDDEHVKRIDVIRPRGNIVTFEFAWDNDAFSLIGYPIGVNEKKTYVLRDLTPEDDGDLDFDLYFDSGIIHHFDDSNSGFIDKVSHIDGRQTPISYDYYNGTCSVGSTWNGSYYGAAGVTIDFTNSTVSSPKYDAVIEWDNGHIAKVEYTSKITDASTNMKKTVTSELAYDEENKKIIGLENSEFPELSFSIEKSTVDNEDVFKIIFDSGNELAKSGNDITFTPDGGAPVTTTTVLNTNGLPTSTTISANEDTATTSYEYISSSERYEANGAPKWGKVSRVTRPDGYSESYEYDETTGWLAKTTSPYAGMVKTVEYGYVGQTHTEHLLERPTKTEEKIAGTRTALSLFSYNPGVSTGRTIETRSLDSGRTLTYTTDRNAYGPPSISTPIGNYSYYSWPSGNNLTISLWAMVPDRWSREEQVISPFGTVIRNEVKQGDNLDLRTALDTVESANPAKINIDSFGRPLKVTHLDGTSEEYVNYGYYGPASVVRKINGLREDEVKYTYDSMGRAVKVESDAQTLDYTYDSLGNITSTAINGTITNISAYDAQSRIVSSTDAVGQTNYTYGFTSDGRKITSTNPEGRTVVTDTYMDGTLKSVCGTAAVPVSYTYTVDPAKGLCVQETRGTTWIKTYSNLLGQPYRTENSSGYWTQNTYDNAGRPRGSYDSEGRTSSTVYNSKNEIARQTVNGITTDFTHAVIQKNGKTVQQTASTLYNSNGNITNISETSVDGRDQWTTVNGRTTHVETTPLGAGNYTVKTTDFEGKISTGNISRNANTTNINSLATVTSEYDGLGRIVNTSDSRKPNGNTFTYRPKTNQIASVFSSDGTKSSYKYTSGKYAPSSFIPAGESNSLGLKYTATGLLEKIIGSSVFDASNIYDEMNRQAALTTKGDAGSATTSLVYDENNAKLKEKWIAGQKCYEFEYEPDGRVKTFKKNITGNDSVKTMHYTPAPNFFNAGYSWNDGTPSVTISGHDSFGQPETVSTGTACTHEFAYNPDSQILSVKFTSNLTGNNDSAYVYQNLRRSQMTSGNDTVNYTYESGRLKSVTSGAVEAIYDYVPQSLNLIDKTTIKKGGTVALVREISWQDNADRIDSMTNRPESGQAYNSFAYQYLPGGKTAKIAREDGSEWRYAYDQRGQLENAARYFGNVKFTGNEFVYLSDSITNVLKGGKKNSDGTSQFETIPGIFNNIQTRNVGDKLEVSGSAIAEATVSVNNAKAGRNKNEFFATIDAGNQESAVSKQVSVVGVVYDPNEVPEIGGGQLGNAVGSDVVSTVTGNVLLPKASENPVYDAGGRLVSTSLWNYTWDSEDRLLAIESSSGNLPESSRVKVEFAYDYSGRRIQKLVYKFSSADNWQLTTDHRYFYDPVLLNGQPADFGLLTAENIVNHETNETIELQYLWGLDLNGAYQGLGGNGGLLAVIDKTHSKVYLPCSDAKGTIHSYVDADTGTVVAKFAYDPYGRIISQTFAPGSSPLPFSLGFQSKYYDSEFQCYYFGFRYFDPATCRWLNRDPLGESGGYNLYAYCNGDPINGMDYLGCVWYNPLDSDFCLYTAGYNTALHIYETGYSPVRAGMRMYDTGASWNLINPLKGSFFAYETLDGGLDALRVAGGLPISIGSGDIFDRQDVANFDPLHPTIIDNGMLNSDQNAKDMQMAVQEKLGITSSGLVKNTSHFLGIGDAVQIFGNEFGLIDITAIRTAQMIRKADSLGTQYIDTINHSQGAETFQTALGLVDSPSILRKIRNQSFGGESYNDAGSLGLASSRNVWNAKGLNALSMNKDWVPTFAMGNPLNAIQTIRKFTGSEWIDTVSREGNNHGFITFYSDLITNYNK